MNLNHPPIPLLDHALAVADKRGMPTPDTGDIEWSLRSVQADFTSQNGFRWPFPGGWAEAADNIADGNTTGCPHQPGDGLCVARTWRGMALGGHGSRTLLLVGWKHGDVLGGDADKLRVRRAFVRDVVDGWRLVRDHGGGADLRRADLRGANLRGAYLVGADLRDAEEAS